MHNKPFTVSVMYNLVSIWKAIVDAPPAPPMKPLEKVDRASASTYKSRPLNMIIGSLNFH